jgi:hypothetical protein
MPLGFWRLREAKGETMRSVGRAQLGSKCRARPRTEGEHASQVRTTTQNTGTLQTVTRPRLSPAVSSNLRVRSKSKWKAPNASSSGFFGQQMPFSTPSGPFEFAAASPATPRRAPKLVASLPPCCKNSATKGDRDDRYLSGWPRPIGAAFLGGTESPKHGGNAGRLLSPRVRDEP